MEYVLNAMAPLGATALAAGKRLFGADKRRHKGFLDNLLEGVKPLMTLVIAFVMLAILIWLFTFIQGQLFAKKIVSNSYDFATTVTPNSLTARMSRMLSGEPEPPELTAEQKQLQYLISLPVAFFDWLLSPTPLAVMLCVGVFFLTSATARAKKQEELDREKPRCDCHTSGDNCSKCSCVEHGQTCHSLCRCTRGGYTCVNKVIKSAPVEVKVADSVSRVSRSVSKDRVLEPPRAEKKPRDRRPHSPSPGLDEEIGIPPREKLRGRGKSQRTLEELFALLGQREGGEAMYKTMKGIQALYTVNVLRKDNGLSALELEAPDIFV